MSLVFSGITPHPPIILPQIGQENISQSAATVTAMQEFAQRLAASSPDLVVFITPHGTVFQDAISVLVEPRLKGSFKKFGHPELAFVRESNTAVARQIIDDARSKGVAVLAVDEPTAKLYRIKQELDHGVLVPLYFFDQAGSKSPVLVISIGMLSFEELFTFGVSLGDTIRKLSERVALIVSGDLSHRLIPGAPAGFHHDGAEFDRRVAAALQAGDGKGIYELHGLLADNAGECGLRPLVIAMGALDGYHFKGEVLSYEGPFGVGYLVAEFHFDLTKQCPPLAPQINQIENERLQRVRKEESPYVKLARQALESYVQQGKSIVPEDGVALQDQDKSGVFVCIKKDGDLRGCIGTIEPVYRNIAEEIIANAISAGVRDPRFEPVMAAELDQLVYTVDILNTPERIESVAELDPQRYGVIVEKRGRRGLLLPMLEGVDTPEQQIEIAKSKAGISQEEEDLRLWRFEVVRYH